MLVIGPGAIEHAIAQYNASLSEYGTLQLCHGSGIGPVRQFPGDGLSHDLRGTALPCGLDQILIPLSPDASVQVRVFRNLRHIIRQIGQLVQDDIRFEITNRLNERLTVKDIAKDRFGTEFAQ